mgnify:CR=1 FL=1
MFREIFINLYLMFFSFFFKMFKAFPQTQKIIFCVSFIENTSFIQKEIKKASKNTPLVFITFNDSCYDYFIHNHQKGDIVLLCKPKKIVYFLLSIYHLATAKSIVVDNYYAFLSVTNFKKSVKILQIWHAVGAIKKFGLEDPSILTRSKKAVERFKKVYAKFHYVIVGSDKMKDIFIKSFNIPPSHFINTGIPRTDIFFSKNTNLEIQKELYSLYPKLQGKKVILYAPTFRNNSINNFTLPLDLKLMRNKLKDEYIFILKLHPLISASNHDKNRNDDFILDLSTYPKLNDLLFITDILITDYSSIPFEFSFFKKQMIFYPFDLEEYQQERGFWEPYSSLVPGPIVQSTEEIIQHILEKESHASERKLSTFHLDWNKYSHGKSGKTVANLLLNWLKE